MDELILFKEWIREEFPATAHILIPRIGSSGESKEDVIKSAMRFMANRLPKMWSQWLMYLAKYMESRLDE